MPAVVRAAISRRQLFQGDLRGEKAAIRPPWALPEAAFIARCDRCGDCVSACPEDIVRIGDGGFPFLDFAAGGCSFCAECLAACSGKALKGDPHRDPPWGLVARIDNSCLAFHSVICRSCLDACDEHAILFRLRTVGAAEPILSTDSCIGCGYCVKACPIQAIKIEVSPPPEAAEAG